MTNKTNHHIFSSTNHHIFSSHFQPVLDANEERWRADCIPHLPLELLHRHVFHFTQHVLGHYRWGKAGKKLACFFFFGSLFGSLFFKLAETDVTEMTVDSYATVKANTQESSGLVSEMVQVCWHGIRRHFARRSNFVSDQQLLCLLQEAKSDCETTHPELVNQQKQRRVIEALMHSRKVLLAGKHARAHTHVHAHMCTHT